MEARRVFGLRAFVTAPAILAIGLLSAPCLTACQRAGAAPGSSKIGRGVFGGAPIAAGDPVARSVVGISFRQTGARDAETCTGVLIAPGAVLTAAHCARGELSTYIIILGPRVEVGSAAELAATGAVTRSAAQITVHPRYEETRREMNATKKWDSANPHDVALIFLNERVPSGFQPAVLAADSAPRAWRAAGFGVESLDLRDGSRTGETILRVATIHPIGSSQPGILVFDQTVGAGICVGDSGGPAFAADTDPVMIYGVASSLRNPGHAEACAGVSRFVSVRAVREWIEASLRPATAEL